MTTDRPPRPARIAIKGGKVYIKVPAHRYVASIEGMPEREAVQWFLENHRKGRPDCPCMDALQERYGVLD